ncbi:MAG: hypothetical protein N4A39_09170 [Roseicyclus sp.]|nr:hypothetical protein [Roseicyclus sp.]
MLSFLLGVGGLVLTIVGFIAGRAVSESEKILAEKRRVYEEFIKACPNLSKGTSVLHGFESEEYQEMQSALLLYCAPAVASAVQQYILAVQEELNEGFDPNEPTVTENTKKASQRFNDIILEMRRDALSWSAFAYNGPSRLKAAPSISSNVQQ